MQQRSHGATPCRIKSNMDSLCSLDLTSTVIIPSKSQSETIVEVVVELALVAMYNRCQLDQQGFVTVGHLKLFSSFDEEYCNSGLKGQVQSCLLSIFAANPQRPS